MLPHSRLHVLREQSIYHLVLHSHARSPKGILVKLGTILYHFGQWPEVNRWARSTTGPSPWFYSIEPR